MCRTLNGTLNGIRRRAVLISRGMTRAEMIRWLGDAISTETEKPFEEIDCDYVDRCGYLLDELMSKSAAMSEEEIADRIAKLKPGRTSTVRKKVGHRNFWNVAVAAAIVLCTSITVVAVPELRVRLMNVLQVDTCESVEEDGITYIHSGETKYYSDIDSLIAAENLDILSFEDRNGMLEITSIEYIDDISITAITFSDPTISFHITHNENLINDKIINTAEKFSTSDFDAYLYSKDDTGTLLYNACIFYNNDTYIIECSTDSTLSMILTSLKKGE